jgi:gamma-glutamyltranspeptidase/glutathione hydrolase
VFYTGELAEMIACDMAANGGLITMEDLVGYKPLWRQPLRGSYRGYDIVSIGPPSSGGVHVIQILNTLENANLAALGSGSSQTVHLLAEAMRYAYADRAEYLGDPDYTLVPVERLTSKDYGRRIYRRIERGGNRAVPSAEVGPGLEAAPREGNHTTHFSAADSRGNAAAVTYTINDWHGCRAAVPGAGFLLNNVMDDFVSKPGTPNMFGLVGGEANSIARGKRPLSCMTPVIVLKDDRFFLTLGSPGGSRIITTVLQVISNVIDHGMNLREAVTAPRIHMQWLPDELRHEPYGLVRDAADQLRDMGYTLTEQSYMGDVNAVMADPTTGRLTGVEDPRREYQNLYRSSPPR